MVQYIITPWRNHRELLQVRQELYPGNEKRLNDHGRRHAVAQVSVWMQRGNCPHLVESSAILTSAILNDVPGNSAYCVRAAYSAAFCRFVTGLLDSHQDKRRKLSMYSIAKTIGLPATYVELRHQATHEELPSLSKLRIATQKALRWIWDYYWAQLSSDVPENDDCKAFLLNLVAERNDPARRNMETRLRNWDVDRLLDTLTEIHGATEDRETLLYCLQLHEKVMSGNLSSGVSEPRSDFDPTSGNLEDVKAELARMEGVFSEDEDEEEEVEQKVPGNHKSGESSSKGWTMWNGPWVPKPIGVV